ncbi:MAG: hypothetical protein AAGI38_23195 [Bacteroidota bacterium]
MEPIISEKTAQVLDILEQIESVNKMIATHKGDSFMQNQYTYKKQQLIQQLTNKLKAFDINPSDLAA